VKIQRWNSWTWICNKRLESFAPLLFTVPSPLLVADFIENHTLLWFEKNPRNKKTRVYSWIAFCRT
jgi:hypothetical protein